MLLLLRLKTYAIILAYHKAAYPLKNLDGLAGYNRDQQECFAIMNGWVLIAREQAKLRVEQKQQRRYEQRNKKGLSNAKAENWVGIKVPAISLICLLKH